MDQFVDMCILCGCDYVNNIRGIGPVRALQMIQKHGTIEVGVGCHGSNRATERPWLSLSLECFVVVQSSQSASNPMLVCVSIPPQSLDTRSPQATLEHLDSSKYPLPDPFPYKVGVHSLVVMFHDG